MVRSNNSLKLGKVQKLFLDMIIDGYNRLEIVSRLKITRQRYYFIRKELQRKGYLDLTFFPVKKVLSVQKADPYKSRILEKWRLHRVQIKFWVGRWKGGYENLKGSWKVSGFQGRSKCCVMKVKDVKIKCYKGVLDVYMGFFYGGSVKDCDRQVLRAIYELMNVLEKELDVVLVRNKEGLLWFDINRREYALEGALNAIHHVKNKERIFVKDMNGRLRYVVDRSLGIPEFESVEPS